MAERDEKRPDAPEDRCRRCGLCCREKVEIDGIIFYTKRACRLWDPRTGLCTIYDRRRERGRDCAELARSIERGLLPGDCPYVRDIPGYDPPVLDWDDPELQAIIDLLPPDPETAPLPDDLARLEARGQVAHFARRREPAARPRPVPTLSVLVLVHRKERASKCSLRPLRDRPGLRFVPARRAVDIDLDDHLLLYPDGAPLSPADRGRPLILVEATWRHAGRLLRAFPPLERRSLPGFATAYPRRSKLFEDPEGGLASAEALFAASVLLGAPDPGWLQGYAWRDAFLRKNRERLLAAGLEDVLPHP